MSEQSLEQITNDDFCLADIFCDEISETENYYRVLDLGRAIANSECPKAVIAAFDRDPVFHDTFNSNGKDVLENMKNYIDASNESLVMDTFKYGVAGLIAGSYYQSLGRIKSVCSKYQADEKTMNRTSLYLPKKEVFFKSVKAAEVLFKVVSFFCKNPNKPFDTTIETLSKSGIKIKRGKAENFIKFDWPQFWGIWLSRIILAPVGNVAGVALASHATTRAGYIAAQYVAGSASASAISLLGRIFGRNSGPIGKRGWTPESLNEAREKVIKLIDDFETLKKNKSLINKDSKDLKQKMRLYKSTIDVYANLIKEAGRGVASSLTYFK